MAAQAKFEVIGGNLQITLSNLTANDKSRSAGELLGRLTFTLSGASGGSILPSSNVGTSVTVNSQTSTTNNGPVGTATIGWGLSSTSDAYTLATVGVGPADYMIIGPGNASGNYPNANNSVFNHSPLLLETATFVIKDIAGLNNATVGDVKFYFNSDGNTVILGTSAVPEPSSMVLAGLASLAGLAGYVRARRRMAV